MDRRIAVAPMIDWTDDLKIVSCINSLESAEKACLLYVSSARARICTLTVAALPVGNKRTT
jgi:hypothetical protein